MQKEFRFKAKRAFLLFHTLRLFNKLILIHIKLSFVSDVGCKPYRNFRMQFNMF